MELIPLDRARYQGYPFQVRYVTDHIYAVSASDWSLSLEPRALEQSEERQFSDVLFADWLEQPVAFGLMEGSRLLAFIEGSIESWHRVFRVSNIFVEPEYRGRGLGSRLLNTMVDYARNLPQCRGVILETQTCNYPAISLYRKHGFRLCRIDTHEYTNRDIARQEVRIDLFLEF